MQAVTAALAPVLALSFALGLVVGSFLNVVVHRVPRGESIVSPRSRCPACGRGIRALENVPVLSWVFLRGRCRGCGARISLRYPLVELATGGLFAATVAMRGLDAATPLWWLFASGLLAAALIDQEHRFIPDSISLGGLALGLTAMPLARSVAGAPLADAALDALLGALLGGGLLWTVGFVHARVCVWLGREFEHWPGEGEALPRPSSLDYWVWFPGLGFGDVKLMAMIGAFVGPLGVVQVIFLAALIGLGFGLAHALARGRLGEPFGFGPAIAIAALAVVAFPLPLPLPLPG